ncbi:hypothetical protein [Burkholderia cenocepacia]|uniref:hypothetical protein n=1 Tax=Burkholderia cenocepacia TaxID=95486 RepID=UPI0011BEC23D|nr:hypothetical protein [Burkholderia cenocepacia]
MIDTYAVKRLPYLLTVCPRFSQTCTRRAGLVDQPRVVLVQSGDFVLRQDSRLIGMAQFGPQLLDLRLVPARFLFALLVTGAPVGFQRIVRSYRRPVLALIALVDFIGWTPIRQPYPYAVRLYPAGLMIPCLAARARLPAGRRCIGRWESSMCP